MSFSSVLSKTGDLFFSFFLSLSFYLSSPFGVSLPGNGIAGFCFLFSFINVIMTSYECFIGLRFIFGGILGRVQLNGRGKHALMYAV